MSNNDLDAWLAAILEARAFKDWTPVVYVSPKTAETIKTVAGYPVAVDLSLPINKVVVRNAEAFEMKFGNGEAHDLDRIVEPGEVMAYRVGWLENEVTAP